MKQISSLLLSCLLLLPAGMNAEEDAPKQWTLRDCIDYALEHNITIQRNRISAESAQEDVKTAKGGFPAFLEREHQPARRQPPEQCKRHHHQRR